MYSFCGCKERFSLQAIAWDIDSCSSFAPVWTTCFVMTFSMISFWLFRINLLLPFLYVPNWSFWHPGITLRSGPWSSGFLKSQIRFSLLMILKRNRILFALCNCRKLSLFENYFWLRDSLETVIYQFRSFGSVLFFGICISTLYGKMFWLQNEFCFAVNIIKV